MDEFYFWGWVAWGIATVIASTVALLAGLWRDRREAQLYVSIPCPGCGALFGQGAYSTWHIRTNRPWRHRWRQGPYLQCASCGMGYRYLATGELHPEQFEEAATELLAKRQALGDISEPGNQARGDGE